MSDQNRLQNIERVEQSKREIDHLGNEIEEWICKRKRADASLQQYHTQLKALGAMLTQALGRLREEVGTLQVEMSTGLLYSACRTHDLRATWLRAVWNYYRSRFDQRDNEKFGNVLAAADEVVWSCYAQAFKNASQAQPQITQSSAPLPYFESHFSPEAIPRDDPPSTLEWIDHSFLNSFLKQLPIPLVTLPSWCLDAPWWLIYLAHEVGHHIQFDLLPDRCAVSSYQNVIVNALFSNGSVLTNDAKTTERWRNWGQEIFADAFSLAAVGGWATWAMVELETQGEMDMLTPKVRYPAPVVRLELMSQMATNLGEMDLVQRRRFDAQLFTIGAPVIKDRLDLRRLAADDLRLAPAVAKAAIGNPINAIGSVAKLAGWRADYARTVNVWRRILLGKAPRVDKPALQTPRLLAGAGTAAWADILTLVDAGQRDEKREQLKEMLPTAIKANREEGTRAATALAQSQMDRLGNQLADLLIHTNPEELGQ